jgi:hypothetical protein
VRVIFPTVLCFRVTGVKLKAVGISVVPAAFDLGLAVFEHCKSRNVYPRTVC